MSHWSKVGAVVATCTLALATSTLTSLPAAASAAPNVTFSFVGDTLLGNTPQLPSRPSTYLDPVRAELRAADVVFGNLEGTFTSSGSGKCGGTSGGSCYQYRNPPSYARIFAADGYHVLNMANNHSNDFGSAGRQSTESAIRNAGMLYSGLPGQITYLTRHGVGLAFVDFAPYYLTNNLLNLSAAARLIRTAHNHARIVVVYMHAGAEGAAADHVTGGEEHYLGEDRGNPRKFAHLAIDNGASIVIASGPHVLRGMEFYKHKLIAYSLGDFANYHNFSSSGSLSRSAILHVTMSSTGAFVAAQLTSVRLVSGGRAYLGGDSVAFVSALSRHDFGATAARISSKGTITQP